MVQSQIDASRRLLRGRYQGCSRVFENGEAHEILALGPFFPVKIGEALYTYFPFDRQKLGRPGPPRPIR